MNAELLFYIIIAIIIADYLLDRYLEFLNSKYRNIPLPEELKGVYDEGRYRKSQNYEAENQRFAFYTSSFNLLLIILFLSFEGFAFVNDVAHSVTEHYLLVPFVFFGILFLALDIINLPFSLYATFVIEEKYGFNKTTPRTFFMDKIKGYILTAILGGGILLLIVWFYQQTGNKFWLYAWGIVIVFSLLLTMFYTYLILPLFNKLTPLEEGDLKSKIVNFSKKVGFRLKDIFVMDGSKRSTKANAFFSGLGKKKRIVLFDTLINELKNNEILAVLAHEIGHYKKKHTLVNFAISVIQTGLTLFILSLLIDNPLLSNALGISEPSFHISLIAFSLLYSPISTILGIGTNYISRKNEYTADEFAKQNGLGNSLIEALKKLSSKNLSNLTPHPSYVFINYSHPALLQRIRYLQGYSTKLLYHER
ncbi:MAG: M48 family metallopeptidase [Bacteroidales bacterium]